MYYVYALVDPINMVPFYIGKGSGNRMFQHLRSDKINAKKVKYIENIRNLGHEPLVEKIVDVIENEKDAYDMESTFIKASVLWGLPIVNRVGVDLKPPSRKGISWKPEWIEKRSKTVIKSGCQKNKIISETQRKQISDKLKGVTKPEEFKKKVSETMKKVWESRKNNVKK